MASLSFFIGVLGNIISLLVFTSPIKTFWRIVKKKSTENYKGIPYTTTLLSTSLWSFYGIMKPDNLVLSVNAAGSCLQLTYVILFLIYAPRNTKISMAKLVTILNVVTLGAVIAITLLALHGKLRITFIGILCVALTIGMYAAPLSIMRLVIKTKSVKYMPFLLSFFLFLNGGVWTFYSFLVKDIYIAVPNGVGFVLGSAQLILYAIYKNKSTPAKSMEEGGVDMDEGNHNDDKDGNNDEGKSKNKSLSKGKSQPKPSVNKEHSLQKTSSSSDNDQLPHSNWGNETDVEKGKTDNHT